VEKKDKKSGVWSPVSRFCRSPSLDVTGLDDGEQYEFRVSAVNDLGQSEPLVTDKPIVAKYQFGASVHADFLHVFNIETEPATNFFLLQVHVKFKRTL